MVVVFKHKSSFTAVPIMRMDEGRFGIDSFFEDVNHALNKGGKVALHGFFGNEVRAAGFQSVDIITGCDAGMRSPLLSLAAKGKDLKVRGFGQVEGKLVFIDTLPAGVGFAHRGLRITVR